MSFLVKIVVTLFLFVSSTSVTIAETDSKKLNRKACEENGIHKESAVPAGSEVLDRYNWLAHGLIESSLDNGFILGFEKLKPHDRSAYENLQNKHLGRYSLQSDNPAEKKVRNKLIDRRLNDPKPLMLTHIVEYQAGVDTSLYNAYTKDDGTLLLRTSEVDRSLPNSLHALTEKLVPKLKARISSGDYTHVVFISMGWNNDQGVSICRISALMENTQASLQGEFKPIVVGVTWPSVVFGSAQTETVKKLGHIGSVFNKANDGDELGVFFGNLVLNSINSTGKY